MLTERDIVARVQHVTVTRLRVWVRQGWIRPAAKAEQAFSEADMARAAPAVSALPCAGRTRNTGSRSISWRR